VPLDCSHTEQDVCLSKPTTFFEVVCTSALQLSLGSPVALTKMSEIAAPIFKKRAPKAAVRKFAPPPSDSSSDGGSSSDDETTAGLSRAVKRRRIGNVGGGISTSSAAQQTHNEVEGTTKYTADRSATIRENEDATRAVDWYDRVNKDEQDDKNELSSKTLLGTARNAKNNASSLQDKEAETQKERRFGPMKAAPSNIRTVTFTDYSPDVCKDYKQTGFCGFGDSCKFLHAREDYAAGWKLDKEWENVGSKKKNGTVVASANRSKTTGEDEGFTEEEIKMLEKIPFKCIICKEDYKKPIVTRCGHHFCGDCALNRYRKKPTCAACGSGTNGVFNNAKGLDRLLKKKAEKEEKAKEADEEAKES
jgi:RING finger protein 113A